MIYAKDRRAFICGVLALVLVLFTPFDTLPAFGLSQQPQRRARSRLSQRTASRAGRSAARRDRTTDIRDVDPGRLSALPYSSVSRLEQQVEFLEDSSEEEWNYHQAYLYWLRQRAYPNDTIDWSVYTEAFAQRDLMNEVSLMPGLPQNNPRWEFVGPQNLPVPYQKYYGRGTTSGRVNGAAFDPAHPGTFYIATAGGGLWKTTDRGRTWMSLSNGPEWTTSKVSSIAVAPANSTIYVGTGDFDGGRSIYGFGLMKSTDGGANWVNLAGGALSGHSIRRILIDPENPNVITLTAGRHPFEWGKVLRSADGGNTWQTILPTPTLPVDADWCDAEYGARLPNGKRYYYAVGHAQDRGAIYRSADNGAPGTWQKLPSPLTALTQSSLDVATSPTSPKTVYLLSGTDRKIWKSVDAGDTWVEITGDFPNGDPDPFLGPNYNWSQSTYDSYIACSTRQGTSQDVLYVGLIDLVASTDGGATWQSVGHTYTGNALTHNDQHTIAINPSNPNEMLVGNDGGIYLLTYDPAAPDPWTLDTSMNATLGITQFYKAAFHPTDPSKMMGGAQDNATPLSLGTPGPGSVPFARWSNIGGGDGGSSAINQRNPNIQYTTSQFLFIYRTGDQWATPSVPITYYTLGANNKLIYWGNEARAFIAPISLDPNNPNLMYAGTKYLWRWDDSRFEPQNTNAAWGKVSGQALASGGNPFITAIAVAPSDSNRIYTGSGTGEVWMTTDRGSNWKKISTGSPSLPGFWVTSIAVDPTNPNNILVGLSGTSSRNAPHPGHLWQCSNTAASTSSWVNRSGSGETGLPNIPLNAIVVDPDNPTKIYYVGTDVGFFLTNDGGLTWGNATTSFGLPNVQVNDLQIVPSTHYLMAATFGRGLWRIRFDVNMAPSDFTFRESNAALRSGSLERILSIRELSPAIRRRAARRALRQRRSNR